VQVFVVSSRGSPGLNRDDVLVLKHVVSVLSGDFQDFGADGFYRAM
jgi:hypothetical protein